MTVLQCGFIANGASSAGRDNVSTSNPTPVISGERKLGTIFEGGWGFGLGCIADDNQCCCWGINAPTILRKQGRYQGFIKSFKWKRSIKIAMSLLKYVFRAM